MDTCTYLNRAKGTPLSSPLSHWNGTNLVIVELVVAKRREVIFTISPKGRAHESNSHRRTQIFFESWPNKLSVLNFYQIYMNLG
jgi:hypothetical protein